MNEQLDELHILQVVIDKDIRPFQGDVLDEAVVYRPLLHEDINMPPDVDARLDTLVFMASRVCRV